VANLPLATWNYKSQDDSIRHIGPMAQDFKAAIGLGKEDTHITTIDADGVALAAIQGMHAELQAQKARTAKILRRKNAQIDALEKRIARLERAISQLTEPAKAD